MAYGPYPSLGVSPAAAARYNSLRANPYGTLGPSPARVARIDRVPVKPSARPAAARPAQKLPAQKPPGMSAEAWARMKSQEYVDSLIAGINQQRESYIAEQRRNAELEMTRGQELSKALQQLGLGAGIQRVYQQAADTQAGLAQGFSGALRDSAAADAALQQRMVSGLGQEGAVRNEGEAMGNATYGIGGFIPAVSLGQQGAAFAADAALQPAYALGQGADRAGAVMREGMGGLDQFAQAIAEARGQQFGIERDLLKERQAELDDQRQQMLAEAKLRLQQIGDDRDYWLKRQAYYIAVKKYGLAAQAEKRAQAAEKRYAYETQGRDAYGNVRPEYVQRADGTIVPRVKPKAPTKPKTLTPGQRQTILQKTVAQEKSMVKDLPELAKRAGLDDLLKLNGPPVPAKLKAAKAQVKKALLEKYGPLATTPTAKKQLRAIIERLLRDYTPKASGAGDFLGDILP